MISVKIFIFENQSMNGTERMEQMGNRREKYFWNVNFMFGVRFAFAIIAEH